MNLEKQAELAKKATFQLSQASNEEKNACLNALMEKIAIDKDKILKANLKDLDHASHLNEAMKDRLSLQGRVDSLIQSVKEVLDLPDPVGEVFDHHQRQGLKIKKIRIPIGVLGVIYESRPNVTIDVGVLALKSGNCALLRGGAESQNSNLALIDTIQSALESVKLPASAIQLVQSTDRSEVLKLLHMHDYIDLIIPRGGAPLHQFCRENSTIPVITGGIGVCHLFVDESANLKKSTQVLINAKTDRPTVCNALDTVLVHEKIASKYIPEMIKAFPKEVSFHLDEASYSLISEKSLNIHLAKDSDWDMEWLSLVLNVKIVKDLNEAIAHIIKHSTQHSDGILTENVSHAKAFVKAIDSAAVYINASTRFTDGGQMGLGAEVAVSTQKIHARGPMGLKELTTYKWVIEGDYAIRT